MALASIQVSASPDSDMLSTAHSCTTAAPASAPASGCHRRGLITPRWRM